MSAEATGWVYRYSPAKGAAFQVHAAIADSANDQNGYEVWMRMVTLGRKARVSTGAARKAVAWLVDAGLLEVTDDGKSHDDAGSATRPRRFVFLMPDGIDAVYDPRPGRGSTKPAPTGEPAPRARGPRPRRGDPRPGRGRSITQGEPKLEPNKTSAPPSASRPGQASLLADPVPADSPPPVALDKSAGAPVDDPLGPAPTTEQKSAAAEIVRKVWDRKTPTPTTSFPGAIGIAARLLAVGWDRQAIGQAMLRSATITAAAVELELRRHEGSTPQPASRATVTTNREGPGGVWTPPGRRTESDSR